jgi:uncharacterized protein YndB with AHSA1/START domain
MSEKPTIHSTFVIERSYPSSPARVFVAFADPAKKRRWHAEGHGFALDEFALDFRVGGQEKSRFRFTGGPPGAPPAGTPMGNDTTYLDIVPDQRIVFAYVMLVGDRRMSVSLATVELTPSASGTRLVFTEQSAFFEPADGPKLREAGWTALLGKLDEEVGRTPE